MNLNKKIFSSHARHYFDKGFSVLPVKRESKRPVIKSWSKFCKQLPTPEEQNQWIRNHATCGISVCCGQQSKLTALDLDLDINDPVQNEIYDSIKHLLPDSPVKRKGKKGHIAFFKWNGEKSISLKISKNSKELTALEVFGDGKQVILPPSIHPETRKPYNWIGTKTLLEIDVDQLPTLDMNNIKEIEKILLGLSEKGGSKKNESTSRNNTLKSIATKRMALGLDDDQIAETLVNEDIRLHTNPLFSDGTEPQMKGHTPIQNALRFVISIRESFNNKRQQSGEPPIQRGVQNKYSTEDGFFSYSKPTQNGPVRVPLCNFTAKITAEETVDDGIERQKRFEIVGTTQSGQQLPRVSIRADQFASLNWITPAWGTSAIINAGLANKDHLRAAIAATGINTDKRDILSHSGWRERNGDHIFIHAGGAVGKDGNDKSVLVDFENARLSDLELPDPPDAGSIKKYLKESLAFLNVLDRPKAIVLLSAVFLAPLGFALPLDFALWLAGDSGVFKSTISALLQSFFGAKFTDRNLPANWESTANSLERTTFLAKDVALVIDDFSPKGSRLEVEKLHQIAGRIIRDQGNRSGRQRMTQDGRLRPQFYPRCLTISSGEDIPHGKSIRARTVIVELIQGDVLVNTLNEAQENAASGIYAASMSSFISWLAPKVPELKKTLPEKFKEYRASFSESNHHKRTPASMASLAVAWSMILKFAVETGAITKQEKARLWADGWEAFTHIGELQSAHQADEDVVTRCISLLESAFLSGEAHLVDAKDGGSFHGANQWGWQANDMDRLYPKGVKVGWHNELEILFNPDSIFAILQEIAKKQGQPIPFSQATLWKRLAERGHLITSSKEQRNKVKRTVEGIRQSVIAFKTSTFAKRKSSSPDVPLATEDNTIGPH